MDNLQSVIDYYEQYGQGHVFEYWDTLDVSSRQQLLGQAQNIDLAEIKKLVDIHVLSESKEAIDYAQLSPAPYIPHYQKGGDSMLWAQARELGNDALASGKVAAFTVAGGQGTRLGYNGPKGTYPVSPVTKASLFEIFAAKLKHAEKAYGSPFYWFIMTSLVNHQQTEDFFKKHQYFGLKDENVRLFTQGLMPAVDFEGKMIMESKSKVAMSPDGHGGSLRALNRSGSIDLMKDQGIEILSYWQVDNPLVKFIDPYFVGFHVQKGSEMSSKMIPKAYPKEKVGHFCMYQDNMVVVEYSDLPDEYQEQTDAEGELSFKAGSVAIHMFDVDFIKRMGGEDSNESLPFHKAVKKVPQLTAAGTTEKPSEPNGVKFEMFVFDALPHAKNPVVIEANREDDFSPVKNAEGVDSPESCERDQLKMFARWLLAAGESIAVDETGLPAIKIEIDPSFAYDEQSFVEAWTDLDEKPEIVDGLVIR